MSLQDRELKWKIIPWRKGIPSKETVKLIRMLEDEGYELEVTTDIGDYDESMCCFLVWGDKKDE